MEKWSRSLGTCELPAAVICNAVLHCGLKGLSKWCLKTWMSRTMLFLSQDLPGNCNCCLKLLLIQFWIFSCRLPEPCAPYQELQNGCSHACAWTCFQLSVMITKLQHGHIVAHNFWGSNSRSGSLINFGNMVCHKAGRLSNNKQTHSTKSESRERIDQGPPIPFSAHLHKYLFRPLKNMDDGSDFLISFCDA